MDVRTVDRKCCEYRTTGLSRHESFRAALFPGLRLVDRRELTTVLSDLAQEIDRRQKAHEAVETPLFRIVRSVERLGPFSTPKTNKSAPKLHVHVSSPGDPSDSARALIELCADAACTDVVASGPLLLANGSIALFAKKTLAQTFYTFLDHII